jgi:hypothetical protein
MAFYAEREIPFDKGYNFNKLQTELQTELQNKITNRVTKQN